MKWSVPLFRVFGIQVQLHGTFLILLVFIALGLVVLPDTAFALFLMLQFLSIFAIILLHELAHSLVAIRFGSKVRNITLLPIGGVAQIENIPEKPVQEILIAVAGPAVNFAFVLAVGLYLGDFNIFLTKASELFSTSAREQLPVISLTEFLVFFGTFNLFIGTFNLLPGFPMDGGRIFRGFLSLFMPFDKATIVAVGVGQLFALSFGVFGILLIFEYQMFYMGIMVIIISFFLGSSGRAEARSVIIKSLLKGVKLEPRMLRKPLVITTEMSNEQINILMNSTYQSIFPVLENGYLVGLLNRQDFMYNMQLSGENFKLPFAPTKWVTPGVDFIALMMVLEKQKSSYVAVTDWYGRYLGVFNTSVSTTVINEQLNMRKKLSLIEHKYLFGK
ncbi:MAG: site-2 protease family protein [Planctomycetes bacterium]|nr:site-2 protease family protein [Planctomycetota bacterium]